MKFEIILPPKERPQTYPQQHHVHHPHNHSKVHQRNQLHILKEHLILCLLTLRVNQTLDNIYY